MHIKIMKLKTLSAFTLTEMLITLAVVGIMMAASAPIISQLLSTQSVTNKNVISCIKANNTASWYNTTTGVGTIPDIATDPKCFAAVDDSIYKRGNALSTALWFADRGSANEKTVARRILRVACDQGSTKACDYFINSCRNKTTATGGSYSYCDDTTGFTDITYYLHQNGTTSAIAGASYIYKRLGALLEELPPSLINEVTDACTKNQAPNQNQNLNANFACLLGGPQLYIKACNIGNNTACKYAYDNNYNRGCFQVKKNWPNATTGAYMLTADGDPTTTLTRRVVCKMDSLATAAISGCGLNGSIPVDDDCREGYLDAYNRACSAVLSYWKPTQDGYYNLTSNGPPPTAPINTYCQSNSDCITKGPGTKCDDGTIYLGQSDDGHDLFTTPVNQPSATWLTRETELTGISDPDNGAWNTAQLLARVSDFAPYNAAERCNILNGVSYLTYTDWFLPSRNELFTIMSYAGEIGDFTYNSHYWSSTEASQFNAYTCQSISTTDPDTGIVKLTPTNGQLSKSGNTHRVRCARKNHIQDMTCPNPGDTCFDTSKYAGFYNGYHLYVPPTDQKTPTSGTSWNNGYSGYLPNIAGLSAIDGWINYGILTTEPVISNVNAPYNAENQCKELNDASYLGYNDWYLPARNESQTLCLYRNVGDLAGTVSSSAAYWTSTPWSSLTCISIMSSAYAYCNATGHCSDSGSVRNVRCIRRN